MSSQKITMGAEEFRAFLDRHGLSDLRGAERLGLTEPTVRKYRNLGAPWGTELACRAIDEGLDHQEDEQMPYLNVRRITGGLEFLDADGKIVAKATRLQKGDGIGRHRQVFLLEVSGKDGVFMHKDVPYDPGALTRHIIDRLEALGVAWTPVRP